MSSSQLEAKTNFPVHFRFLTKSPPLTIGCLAAANHLPALDSSPPTSQPLRRRAPATKPSQSFPSLASFASRPHCTAHPQPDFSQFEPANFPAHCFPKT